MTEDETKPSFAVTLTGPELWELRFVRWEPSDPIPQAESIQFHVNLTMARPHARHLAVRMNVRLEGPGKWSEFSVAYHVEYQLRGVLPEAPEGEIEAYLHRLGTISAPLALFPFVRETVASVTQRTGQKPVVLPLMDFSGYTDFALPEPVGETPPEFLEPVRKAEHANAPDEPG